jgi:hypothetical protein
MAKLTCLAAVACLILTSGCASIVNGTNQVMSIDARQKDSRQLVVGANCELNNGKGVYYVTTPGTVVVSRAYEPLSVKCEKDSYQPGIASVPSATKGMAFGNIIFGGIIGAGVDMASGAAYDYPNSIRIIMGERITAPAALNPDATKVSLELQPQKN